MNIADTIQPGYKALMTSYLSSSIHPGKILRLQYQRNDKTKDTAFLGKPRHLNNKEQKEFNKKGFLKGDYDKDGNKLG